MTFLPSAPAAGGPASTGEADGRIPELESAMLTNGPSYEAQAQWYALRDELVPYIGQRAVNLFSYAISDANGSALCTEHFRRILLESGDAPDDAQVTEVEQLLIDWGRLIARDPAAVPDEMVARLEKAFHPELRVALVAYAGQTVAANLVAAAGRISAAG